VSVLRGNGDGTFRDPVSYLAGRSPGDLVVGDFLGHGRVDLATANFTSSDVTVLLNQGPPAPPAVGGGAAKDAGGRSRPEPVAVAAATSTGDAAFTFVLRGGLTLDGGGPAPGGDFAGGLFADGGDQPDPVGHFHRFGGGHR
jgi:hypothetical protein